MSTMRLSTTGSTAITTTLALDPKRAFQINEIELHLNGAGGATGDVDFTVTKDANAGTPYDLLLLTEDMTTDTDVLVAQVRGEDLDVDSGFQYVGFKLATGGNGTEKVGGVLLQLRPRYSQATLPA